MPDKQYSSNSYRYGFNGKEKDNEIKGSGNSYDFGARMYDPRLGRWASFDPEFMRYAPVSPYAAFVNSPIIAVDPDGEKVRVMSEDALNVLLSSLSPEDRKRIKVNRKGYIKERSVRNALKTSNSGNLAALYILVKDKQTIELYTEEKEYTYINVETGKPGTEVFEAPIVEPSMYQQLMNEYKGTEEEKVKYGEKLKEVGILDEPTIQGNFGSTLRPMNAQDEFPGGKASPTENMRVYVNPVGTSGEEKAGNIGHELFGHALYSVLGLDPTHGGATGSLDGNLSLERTIDERTKESKENFKKGQK